jgi:uncharacterized membrane protein YfcA
MMDIINLLIIFLVGIVSASFGTLVGGGSLITIPTLIFLGLPPHVAIGTNRLGTNGMIISGLYAFHKKRMIDYRIGLSVCIPTLLGSFLGANLVLQVNVLILRYVIAVITIVMLCFTFLKPEIGIAKTKQNTKKNEYSIAVVLSFFIGIYGGFYGAGVGTFVSYVLILLFGQTFLESAATRKTVTLFPSVLATTVFVFAGVITYSLGIALFIGNFIGSYVGAHYSDKIGNVWVKRMFFGIVLIMAIKLII